MCPLLAPASKGKLLLFFSFFVAAAIDSTTEANKAPLSSLYSLDVYDSDSILMNENKGKIKFTAVTSQKQPNSHQNLSRNNFKVLAPQLQKYFIVQALDSLTLSLLEYLKQNVSNPLCATQSRIWKERKNVLFFFSADFLWKYKRMFFQKN
jgi:hypothetical protein